MSVSTAGHLLLLLGATLLDLGIQSHENISRYWLGVGTNIIDYCNAIKKGNDLEGHDLPPPCDSPSSFLQQVSSVTAVGNT